VEPLRDAPAPLVDPARRRARDRRAEHVVHGRAHLFRRAAGARLRRRERRDAGRRRRDPARAGRIPGIRPDELRQLLRRRRRPRPRLHRRCAAPRGDRDARLARVAIASMPTRRSPGRTRDSPQPLDERTNTVHIGAAQAFAARDLERQVAARFRGEATNPSIRPVDLRRRRAARASRVLLWGAWCAAPSARARALVHHNWPYDELAGNRPARKSCCGALWPCSPPPALGGVLFAYGRYSTIADAIVGARTATAQAQRRGASSFRRGDRRSRSKRAIGAEASDVKFFSLPPCVSCCRSSPHLTVTTSRDHARLRRRSRRNAADPDRARMAPATRAAVDHRVLDGSSILCSPMRVRTDRGARRLVDAMFVLLVVTRGGWPASRSPARVFGATGTAGQPVMGIRRAGAPVAGNALRRDALWRLCSRARCFRPGAPATRGRCRSGWSGATPACCCCSFPASFGARDEFVVADSGAGPSLMWVEASTRCRHALLAYCMVLMRLVRHAAASASLPGDADLLGSGLPASRTILLERKPVVTLAIAACSRRCSGALILLTSKPGSFRNARSGAGASFAHGEAFLFLLGVNFWNFLGAACSLHDQPCRCNTTSTALSHV